MLNVFWLSIMIVSVKTIDKERREEWIKEGAASAQRREWTLPCACR